MHPDGTVTTIYDRAPSESFSYWSGGGETSTSAIVERAGSSQPIETTSYYLTNQVGSTMEMLSSGGWPVSQDTIFPYGMEPSPPASPNSHKFAGMKRDQESELDHTPFRQYAAQMGRWMTPDPYNGSYDLANPQTFNRYVYAVNNPLGNVDPTGLYVEICGEEGGCEIITDQEYQDRQGWSGGVNDPPFSNVYNQGLAGIYDKNGNQVGTATYISDSDLGVGWGTYLGGNTGGSSSAAGNDPWAGYTLAQQVFQGPGSGVFVGADKAVHGLAVATGAVAAVPVVAPAVAAAAPTTLTAIQDLLLNPSTWTNVGDFIDGTMPVGVPAATYAAGAGQVASYYWDKLWNNN